MSCGRKLSNFLRNREQEGLALTKKMACVVVLVKKPKPLALVLETNWHSLPINHLRSSNRSSIRKLILPILLMASLGSFIYENNMDGLTCAVFVLTCMHDNK